MSNVLRYPDWRKIDLVAAREQLPVQRNDNIFCASRESFVDRTKLSTFYLDISVISERSKVCMCVYTNAYKRSRYTRKAVFSRLRRIYVAPNLIVTRRLMEKFRANFSPYAIFALQIASIAKRYICRYGRLTKGTVSEERCQKQRSK